MASDADGERVVIVGGGFAGVTLAQQLERALDDEVEILVVSKDNHLVFTPMLPEVAARTISPLHVVVPGRETTRRTQWVAAEVTGIDSQARTVEYELADGRAHTTRFSHLVLACGLGVNLAAVPGLAAHGLPIKSISDAFTIGNEVIARFEQAVAADDDARRRELLTVVVIGGGFSGVEVAGHLFDFIQNVRPFYRQIRHVVPRLVLLQGGDRILPELQHESLSAYALRKLTRRGVDVRLGARVQEVTGESVTLRSGERVRYGLLIGTLGNDALPFVGRSALPIERGRVRTTPDMRVEGQERLWAIGDCARIPNAHDGTICPPTAQFALRQARQLARNLRGVYGHEPLGAFRYRPQGLLASIGQRTGVAEIYGMRFSGFPAWFLWRGVYLAKMPTIARKVGVAVDWAMDALFPANTVRIAGDELGRIRRQHFAQGEIVYRQGDAARWLYLIESGTALVARPDVAEPVATLREGDYFGTSTARGARRAHATTVSASSPLDVVVLDRATLEHMSRSLGVANREVRRSGVIHEAWETYTEAVHRSPGLARLRVRDVMVTPRTIAATEPWRAALAPLAAGAMALAVVEADGTLSGYCGREELTTAIGRGLPFDKPMREVAATGPMILSVDHSLPVAMGHLLRSGRDLLAVTDGGHQVVGMFGLLEAVGALTSVDAEVVHDP